MSIDTLKLENDRRLVALMLGLLLVPVLWYVRTDFALYAGDVERLSARLVVRIYMVIVPVVGILLVRSAFTREQYSGRVFGVACGIAILLLVINVLRPAGSTLPLRSPLLHLAVMYGALPNTFWRQVTPPLLLAAGLVTLRLTLLDGGANGDVGGDVLILCVFSVVGVGLVRRRLSLERDVGHAWTSEREARVASERALAEVRTLRGLIPICSHCKKVRTGVDDWRQIEQYVREHSEAEFSHGICPECLQKHYGDVLLGGAPK
ncbi:MAG: hypothetical protein ACRENH_05710 [Gemmatimonadaceae bacterium]